KHACLDGCGTATRMTPIEYAKFRSRSHHAMIRVYHESGNVIDTHEHAGEFRAAWSAQRDFRRRGRGAFTSICRHGGAFTSMRRHGRCLVLLIVFPSNGLTRTGARLPP